MDFCQAFVIGASWNKDELIRFRGQRGKGQGHYCGRGVYDSKATFEFSFLGWMPLLSLNRSTEPFFSDAVYTSDQSKKAKELVCKLCLLSSVKFTCWLLICVSSRLCRPQIFERRDSRMCSAWSLHFTVHCISTVSVFCLFVISAFVWLMSFIWRDNDPALQIDYLVSFNVSQNLLFADN